MMKSRFAGSAVLLVAAALGGCASPEQRTAPAGSAASTAAPSASVIVLTAENMNAHSSIPALNAKLGSEVLSVANRIASQLEGRGQTVAQRNFKQAAPQDVARIIKEAKGQPTRLLQVYWSVDDKNDVHLNIDSLPIVYSSGTAHFGNNAGTKFQILGPKTYSTKTAEQMADEFLKSQGG